MRTVNLAAAVAGTTAVAQQTPPSIDHLSLCGQICVTNMIAQAGFLGCKPGDSFCLCNNANFGYGIRDCANQACHPSDAVAVINYGINYCAIAANPGPVKVTDLPPPAANTAMVAPDSSNYKALTAPLTVTPALSSVTATVIKDQDGNLHTPSPSKTAAPVLVSTYTSGSETVTTTIDPSLSQYNTAAVESEISSKAKEEASSSVAEESSSVESKASESLVASKTAENKEGAATSSVADAGAMATAMPVVGLGLAGAVAVVLGGFVW